MKVVTNKVAEKRIRILLWLKPPISWRITGVRPKAERPRQANGWFAMRSSRPGSRPLELLCGYTESRGAAKQSYAQQSSNP
jgi:hypothetical protein